MTDEHDKALAPTETAEAQWARAEDRVQMANLAREIKKYGGGSRD